MLTFSFDKFDMSNQIENPITVSLLLSLSILLIIFFIIENLTWFDVQKIFLCSFAVTYCIIWAHFRVIKKKFKSQLIDTEESKILTQTLEEFKE